MLIGGAEDYRRRNHLQLADKKNEPGLNDSNSQLRNAKAAPYYAYI